MNREASPSSGSEDRRQPSTPWRGSGSQTRPRHHALSLCGAAEERKNARGALQGTHGPSGNTAADAEIGVCCARVHSHAPPVSNGMRPAQVAGRFLSFPCYNGFDNGLEFPKVTRKPPRRDVCRSGVRSEQRQSRGSSFSVQTSPGGCWRPARRSCSCC